MRPFIILALLSLCACATLKPGQYSSVKGLAKVDPSIREEVRRNIGESNYKALYSMYNEEWKYNKKDEASPPRLGISLSGGGTRSASFSIGVLQGLSDLGILDEADIMSSVSGGGYALSWYYLQKLYSPKYDILPVSDQDLFLNTGKFQNYLLTHGELMGTANIDAVRFLQYSLNIAATVATIPLNFALNGAFGLHFNTVPVRWAYQNGIEREYHTVPRGDGSDKLNNHRLLGIPTMAGIKEQVSFQELDNFIKTKHLPYVVVNTTAHISDSYVNKHNEAKSRVFEFTPMRYGSDYFGYKEYSHPISLNKAVSVSGAAADSKLIQNGAWSAVASAFNADLGYYIENPNLPLSDRVLPRLLPFPLYLLSGRHSKDINGTSIYLADGGHIENLGAFSLVRRLTRRIVIVDAEYDPNFQFQGFKRLKETVENELEATLHVEDIENNLGNAAFFGQHPVLRGKVSDIPYTRDGKIDNLELDVIYVKMSIDKDRVSNKLSGYNHSNCTYPISIVNYYLIHQADGTNFINEHGAFPHQSTSDQTYDMYQVSAYRDLGYEIVKNNSDIFKELLRWPSHTMGAMGGVEKLDTK